MDHYSPQLLFALTLILGLNILDSWFTMMILQHGGIEVNPIVESAIELYGDQFWLWKFGLVAVNLVILCLHSRFKPVNLAIVLIALVYLAVVVYQITLLTNPPPLNIP